ncbi:unnamed protein product, partial [Amoebophrya sp. A120]
EYSLYLRPSGTIEPFRLVGMATRKPDYDQVKAIMLAAANEKNTVLLPDLDYVRDMLAKAQESEAQGSSRNISQPIDYEYRKAETYGPYKYNFTTGKAGLIIPRLLPNDTREYWYQFVSSYLDKSGQVGANYGGSTNVKVPTDFLYDNTVSTDNKIAIESIAEVTPDFTSSYEQLEKELARRDTYEQHESDKEVEEGREKQQVLAQLKFSKAYSYDRSLLHQITVMERLPLRGNNLNSYKFSSESVVQKYDAFLVAA